MIQKWKHFTEKLPVVSLITTSLEITDVLITAGSRVKAPHMLSDVQSGAIHLQRFFVTEGLAHFSKTVPKHTLYQI